MENRQWFESWFDSKYYPILYNHRDEDEATLFVDSLLQFLHAPRDSKILDLACGQGRFSRALGAKGYQVTGIDLSESSIEVASSQEDENTEFYIHDMRKPFRYNYFDFIFNFFTSFGYFETYVEHEETLKSIAKGLKTGGMFVLDFLNVHMIDETHKVETVVKNNVEFILTRYSTPEEIVKEIHVIDGSLEVQYEERVKKFDEQILSEMIVAAGMSVVDKRGNYKMEEFDASSSPRLILIAQRV